MTNNPAPRTAAGFNPHTLERLNARRADWRVGHVLYQIFVDRFAPSRRLDAKREHYAAPRQLRTWEEVPASGHYLHDHLISEQEVQFWGGDLESVRAHLDHIAGLGVDVVYLNPVFQAFSNHKYDAMDYRTVDPQYGTNAELRALSDDLHGRGMKLMLDGVLNHMGRRSPKFQSAATGPASPDRDYYRFHESYRHGYLGWRNSANLPEVNLENPAVREDLITGPNSVVRHWFREADIDGWRLDVAPDLGFEALGQITDAAHDEKPGSVVIGECWNYPEEWLGVMDGVMNMHLRLLLLHFVEEKMSPLAIARCIERMVEDAGIEGILRSHIILDNHDVPRIATLVGNTDLQRILRVLQFTLPGCPVVYYGSELGMLGGHDPSNRAPMRWDLVGEGNEELSLVRRLGSLRHEFPALRFGDFRVLDAEGMLVFSRTTERARDTIIVAANPGGATVDEMVSVRTSRLMDAGGMQCVLSGEKIGLHCGMAEIKLPPRSVRVFRTLDFEASGGYSLYKRVP